MISRFKLRLPFGLCYSATLTNITILQHQLRCNRDTSCSANQNERSIPRDQQFFFQFSIFISVFLSQFQFNYQMLILWKHCHEVFRDKEHQIMACSKIILNSYRRSWSAKQSVPLQIYPKKWWLIINCYYSTLTIPRDKTDKVNPFMNRDVFSQKWDTKKATIFATPT